jgi:hypothetical protein
MCRWRGVVTEYYGYDARRPFLNNPRVQRWSLLAALCRRSWSRSHPRERRRSETWTTCAYCLRVCLFVCCTRRTRFSRYARDQSSRAVHLHFLLLLLCVQAEFRMHMSGCQWLPLEAQKAIRSSEPTGPDHHTADVSSEAVKALPDYVKQVGPMLDTVAASAHMHH